MTSVNVPTLVRGHGAGGPDLTQGTGKVRYMTTLILFHRLYMDIIGQYGLNIVYTLSIKYYG